MENKIGALIGVVKHSFSCTPTDGSKGHNVQCSYDFTNTTDSEIKTWLAGSRAIAQAKVVNRLTVDEIDKQVNGVTFAASSVGNKIKSLEEQKRDAIAVLNVLKESNPEQFAAIMGEMI